GGPSAGGSSFGAGGDTTTSFDMQAMLSNTILVVDGTKACPLVQETDFVELNLTNATNSMISPTPTTTTSVALSQDCDITGRTFRLFGKAHQNASSANPLLEEIGLGSPIPLHICEVEL
ncbi:unnamed protein product, partial [Amoebophrya sp. A120]